MATLDSYPVAIPLLGERDHEGAPLRWGPQAPDGPERPPEGELWFIEIDRYITRRKLFHIVANPQGEIMFRSRLLGDCIRYLEAEGQTEYMLFCPNPEVGSVLCRTATRKVT